MKRLDRWMGRALIEVPFYWALCLSESAFWAELRMLNVPRADWPSWLTDSKADATVHWLEAAGHGGRDCYMVCMKDPHKHTPIEVAPSDEFEAYAIQRLSINLMDAYAKTLAAPQRRN